MKHYYRIKEISDMFGIGPDSLRYYEEIGILRPKRGENRYRLYGMRDIYRLNVVKDLRQLGFSMERIREYLDHKSIANTIGILREESELLGEEIRRMRTRERVIRARILELTGYLEAKTGVVEVVHLPRRICLRLEIDVKTDEEIDFALNKLHRRLEHRTYVMNEYMLGASQHVEDLRNGVYGQFRSVFIILEPGDRAGNAALPAGDYLSLHYRGDNGQSAERIREVLAYADAHAFEPCGDILELYEIDIHETNNTDEFITEVQLMVKPRETKH